MMLLSENLLLLASLLVFVAILVSKVGSKLGAPSLLVFLLLGMLVGTDGIGLRFDNYEVAESIGHFAMTIIMFTAGLETSFAETRPVIKQGIVLSTLGVLFTVVLTGLFIWITFGRVDNLPVLACLLLAAVMGSTDSASVFSVLREKKLHLRENLSPMLELESGSNDPMAYVLTLTFISLVLQGGSPDFGSAVLMLFTQLVIGAVAGWLLGKALVWCVNKINIDNDD